MRSLELFLCGFLQNAQSIKEAKVKEISDDYFRRSHSLLEPLPIQCSCKIAEETKFALTKNFLYYSYENKIMRHCLKNSLKRKGDKELIYSDAEIINTSTTGNQYIKSLHAGTDIVAIILGDKEKDTSITLTVSDDGSSSTLQTGEDNMINFKIGKTFKLLSAKQNKVIFIDSKDKIINMNTQHLPSTSLIQTLACGKEHALVLTCDHKVFTMGGGSRGQLGNGGTEYKPEFSLVTSLEPLQIDNISAGGWHSLVLSNGDLYGWGWNESGQIGCTPSEGNEIEVTEDNVPKLLFHPALVETPIDKTFLCMSTGSRHSAAVSADGLLYTWGWNAYGQLCHGDQEKKFYPCKVKIFEKQKVIDVHCSDWATLVITASTNDVS